MFPLAPIDQLSDPLVACFFGPFGQEFIRCIGPNFAGHHFQDAVWDLDFLGNDVAGDQTDDDLRPGNRARRGDRAAAAAHLAFAGLAQG